MDNLLKFTVPGKIQPKQSARFTRFGVYQNPKVRDYEKQVQLAFKEKYPGDARFPSNMPLIINIDVFLPIPKSKNINWKIDAAEGFIRPTTRPDTDNCAKVIKDALNGFAYYDDRQIISEHINKWYSSEPRVEVVIEGGWND